MITLITETEETQKHHTAAPNNKGGNGNLQGRRVVKRNEEPDSVSMKIGLPCCCMLTTVFLLGATIHGVTSSNCKSREASISESSCNNDALIAGEVMMIFSSVMCYLLFCLGCAVSVHVDKGQSQPSQANNSQV